LNSSQRTALTLCLCATLAACGSSLSDVGEQPELAPTAIAGVVGYSAADASGDVTTDVRAGTQLLLTGKDSIEYDKPILSFQWEPANAAASAATIVIRTTNTVAVNVPAVAQVTEMQFRLTVRDSDGDTDTALVRLRVQPRLDSDRFLQYVRNVSKLRVVAGTSQPAAAGTFEVTMTGHLTYTARSGAVRTVDYPIGTRVPGNWLASNQPTTDLGAVDFRNPLLEFPFPAIDQDTITRRLQQDLPGSAPEMADPAFIDDASLALTIRLAPTSATSTASLYVLDANDQVVAQGSNGGSGAAIDVAIPAAALEELRITSGGLENRDTAQSYYDAIDPQRTKLTLRQWLIANCFDPAASDYGADAHSLYVNDFDLGFGRDMYFRTTRPAGCASSTFAAGDIASIVINYPTLEAAAKKIGAVIAVGMEYEAVDANHSAPGRVTFYAFAPDEGTGEFRRVKSANFDGRGEKYIPGACTTCHGGRPKAPQPNRLLTYTSAADTQIGATFMPWDLESFLFSDTDSTFPRDASNAALRATLTRSQQEAQLKRLNLAAYSTYGSGSGSNFACHAGFAGPCQLIEMWYGGAGTPSPSFRDRQVAPGWQPGGANPATSGEIYLDVFARNCRACHTQRVVALNATSDPQFLTYGEFTQTIVPAWRNQVVEQVFQVGGMPAARLTMDRFWTAAPGATSSAGDILAQHLAVPAAVRPGVVSTCFNSVGATPQLATTPANRQRLERGEEVAVNAGCSLFANAFSWQLAVPNGSGARLTANSGARAAFTPDRVGNYDLTLQITGPQGDSASLTRYAFVENLVPVAANLAASIDLNATRTVDVLTPASLGDPPVTVSIDSMSSGLSASVDANQRIVVMPTTLQGGTINYRITDVDGGVENSDTATITVTVNASITADNIPATLTPNSSNNQIVLSTEVSAQFQPFTVNLVGTGTTTSGGTVTVVNCGVNNIDRCARYTPPAATITIFGTTRIAAADTFVYRACFVDQPANCDNGTVTIEIAGSAAFSTVATIMKGTCLSCHSPAPPIGAVWGLPDGNATDKQAWCAVRFQNGLDEPVGSPPLVNPANPAASLLYRKPQGFDTHVVMLTEANALPILNWIREGAAFTGGTSQTCP
jgi:mono/diheme cytochrome c family protein